VPTDDDTLTRAESRFADSVAQLRKDATMTQEELAVLMRERGLKNANQTTVSRIEAKKRPVTLGEATALSRIFDRTIAGMSNPDGREGIMALMSSTHRSARKHFAEMRTAAKQLVRLQDGIQKNLDQVRALFPEREGLTPDTAKDLQVFEREALALIAIDLVDEVAQIQRSVNDGKHQEET
jgi:transcriptional regulator with XRE-family HTH domain